MATITAAAAGGNWNVGATWVGGVAPGSGDDVILNATSGNVNITTAAAARSLDATGYTGTLSHGAFTLSIGDATAGTGNVALKLSAGMTYAPASGRLISFVSTSATQQTITTAGKTLGAVTFAGAGSSYILSDALTVASTSTLTLTAGTFNTGNFAVTSGTFVTSGAVARTLTMGSSAIALNGGGTTWNASGSGLTVTANTATVTAATPTTIAGGGFDYNGLTLVLPATTGNPTITGSNTWGNLTRTGSAAIDASLILGGNQTVTGTLTLTGNSAVNRLWVLSNLVGTTRTLTVNGSVVASRVDFEDITGAGSASWNLSAILEGSGDIGGNSGITFTTPTNKFAVNGGNWSSTGNWSLSSGGGAGAPYPLPQDDVFLDAGSGAVNFTMNMQRHGRNIDATGFTGTLTLNNSGTQRYIFGSLILSSGMTFTAQGNFTFGGRGSHTIDMQGKAFTASVGRLIQVGRFGGTYTLDSNASFGTSVSAVTTALQIAGGVTFNANNFNVTAPSVNASTGTVNMGSGTWTLTSTGAITVWTAATATVNAGTSSIVISNTSASTRTFAGGSKTYYDLSYTVAGSTGEFIITGSNTFHNLNVSDANNARTFRIGTGATTTTITGAFNVFGSPGNLITIDTSGAGTHNLVKSSGVVSTVDYLAINDSNAGGGATWYAGANSVSGGGNTGWIFAAAPSSQGNFFMMF